MQRAPRSARSPAGPTKSSAIVEALNAFPRLVAAICCAAAALVLWDLGSRSPGAVLNDVLRAFTSLPRFLGGILRIAIGALCAYASILLVAGTLRYGPVKLFSLFAIATFLAALLVDALIGDAVRRIARFR